MNKILKNTGLEGVTIPDGVVLDEIQWVELEMAAPPLAGHC